jgi:PEGA domain
MCRVAVLAGVALAASAPAAADERRVGFAVLTDEEAGSAVESARAECAAAGLVPIPDGELRQALEQPLEPGADETGLLARAGQRLRAAREAYSRFDENRARAQLLAVDRLLLDREPTPALVELLAERHLVAGLVHETRGQRDEARRAFRLVRELDPSRRALDPAAYRPQVVELFARAARGRGTTSLRVRTAPAGARVYLDGRAVGRAPLELEGVSAGRHWLVAAAPGHRPRGALIDVDADRPASETLSLGASLPAERAAELRRTLRAASGARERRAAAAELAGTAGADLLVLVRERAGSIEGAVFDARRGLLSAWVGMPSERFSSALSTGVALEPGASGALTADAPAQERRSWYSTWWGRSLLIAGGIAVGAAAYFALSSGDEAGYSVGDFCFAGRDC